MVPSIYHTWYYTTLLDQHRRGCQFLGTRNLVSPPPERGTIEMPSVLPFVRPSVRPSVRPDSCYQDNSRSRSQAISSENLVSTITQEGSHVGFSNLYQACICKRSRTSLDSGDLDLKVRVTGHFFFKSCDRVNSITKSRRLLKFIPKMYL